MSTTRRGFSIRTFLADGTPDSLQLIEHSQWVGRGTVIPRATFDQHASRPELGGTGIFVLDGPSPETGCERVYIGQVSNLRDDLDRLKKKSFWNRMVVFTAEGPRLHRAHTDYIEARLLELARDSAAAELDNTKAPTANGLGEADRADADYFIDQVMLVAPSMGVRAFEQAPAMPRGAELLRLTGNGANASGYRAGGRFVVQEGSMAARSEGAGCPGHINDLRSSLVARGVLADEGKQYKFTQAYAFASAAQAAMLVLGTSADDAAWRAGQGQGGQPQQQNQQPPQSQQGLMDDARHAPGRDDDAGMPSVTIKPIRATKPTSAAID